MGYHIVWSVKYRRKILVGQIESSLKDILHGIAEEKGFIIKAMECDLDHIHVFVSAKPKIAPSYIYKMLKGISARRLFAKHPEIKSKLWNGHIWSPSTYIETICHISEATVQRYIEDQKQK
jgi:putative transposase